MDNNYKRKGNYKPRGGSFNNWNSSKKKFKNYLAPGMKGFLCTCNFKEKECVRESYNILNEYAEKLFGVTELQQPSGEAEQSGDTGDIEDELKREVRSLQAAPRNLERFLAVDTGIGNNIFIKTTIEDPVKLGFTILNDIFETKAQKARFVLRIVPVEITCKANLEDIKSAADSVLEKHFRCEPTTFAVVVNKRYNNSVLRDEVIQALALLVTDRNQDHKANLKDAKKTVIVEIMKGICCISVLEDYKRLRHYNLAELVKPDASETEKSENMEAEKPAEPEDGEEAHGDEGDGVETAETQENNEAVDPEEGEANLVEEISTKTEEPANKPGETPT